MKEANEGDWMTAIWVRQCLTLIAVEQHDVAGLGLLFAQLQGQMLFGRDRLPGRVATRVVISQVSQPSNTAPARSASPRSREPASAVSAARSSLVAESGDRPVVLGTCELMPQGNQPAKRWSSRQILLRKMARGPLPN